MSNYYKVREMTLFLSTIIFFCIVPVVNAENRQVNIKFITESTNYSGASVWGVPARGSLIGQHGDRVNLDLEVRGTQGGDLDLGAGGEGAGEVFAPDLAAGGSLSQVGDKAGDLDHVAQGGAVGLQDVPELLEDRLGLRGNVAFLRRRSSGRTAGDEK